METAKFCGFLFLIYSVVDRTLVQSKKSFIMPYTSPEDELFSWLLEKFVKYINDWKQCVSMRPGEFSED